MFDDNISRINPSFVVVEPGSSKAFTQNYSGHEKKL